MTECPVPAVATPSGSPCGAQVTRVASGPDRTLAGSPRPICPHLPGTVGTRQPGTYELPVEWSTPARATGPCASRLPRPPTQTVTYDCHQAGDAWWQDDDRSNGPVRPTSDPCVECRTTCDRLPVEFRLIGTPRGGLPWRAGMAGMGGHAVHRTMVLIDVEGFGAPGRTLPHQLDTRAELYRVVAPGRPPTTGPRVAGHRTSTTPGRRPAPMPTQVSTGPVRPAHGRSTTTPRTAVWSMPA
jgi:hypothetical protein